MENPDVDILNAVLAQLDDPAAPATSSLEEEDSEDRWDEAEENHRWTLPGLAPMTRVSTSFGEVFAHALRKGDLVLTPSSDFLPIVWIDRVTLDAQLLCALPDAQSIEVLAGVFGRKTPEYKIRMSPAQMLLPAHKGGKGELCTARSLLGRPGIKRHHETAITYTRFRLQKPSLVCCEGVWLAAG